MQNNNQALQFEVVKIMQSSVVAGHMVQLVEPWGANEPGGQKAAAPAYDEVPGGQELQALAPGDE